MSQRNSGYEGMPNDLYCTPDWVTYELMRVEEFPAKIWEPACGYYHMIRALVDRPPYKDGVYGTDINDGDDFLSMNELWCDDVRSIITNPPFSKSDQFVRHALKLTEPVKGKVAMLLPLAWDSAKGRRDLFAEHPAFKAKYTLTRRIRWENLEQKKAGPSQNHAWYVWDWKWDRKPFLGWLP